MEEKNVKEFEILANQMADFLKKNFTPHATIIINQDCVKVVTDEINIPVHRFSQF